MRRKLFTALPVCFAFLAMASVSVTGCGEDTVTTPDGGTPIPGTDSGPGPGPDTGPGPGPDGGPRPDGAPPPDGGTIEFSTFVIGLIETQTTDQAEPTTTEDKSFTDMQSATAFDTLFP